MPLPLDPLQLAGTAVTEDEIRPRHDITDGFGNENLATRGLRHDTRRDVNRDQACGLPPNRVGHAHARR